MINWFTEAALHIPSMNTKYMTALIKEILPIFGHKLIHISVISPFHTELSAD